MNIRFTRAILLFIFVTVSVVTVPVTASDITNAATSTEATSRLPRGVIVMWAGNLKAIPTGWSLCDGRNGTPDLRDRFVMGVGAVEYMGTTGGSLYHRHIMESHRHYVDPPRVRVEGGRSSYSYTGPGYRSLITIPSGDIDIPSFMTDAATPGSQDASNYPPYYKIAFIMKD